MNYKKSLFITLLSVSVLGATTTTHAFAEQNEKTGVSAPAIPTEKAGASVTTPTAGKATTPAKQNVSITLSDYVVGRSLYITGTYNNTNAVYVRAEVNGQKKTLVSSKELASGKINYYVGNLKANDKAEIVLFNKDYQEIGRQQVTIKEPVKTQITLEPYVVGRSLNITGNYNGTNAAYMRAEVNGQKKGLVSSKGLASGKISYYVGNLKATDKAEIVLFDKNYQEIGRQQVSFTEPVKTVVTLDKYVVGTSTTISGTYNGTNAVYMQAVVNGKKESLIQSKGLATGKISYYVGKLNTGDQAEIILFDKNYQEIGRQQVEIDGPAQVSMKLDNYTIGRSTNITGTYTGTDAKYIQAEVNGQKKVLVQSKELASGKINYYIGNLKAGDKVDIVLYNKDYLEIGRQQVTLVEPVPIKFTLDNYVLGDSNSITGTYDGTNAVYMQAEVNGKKEALVKSKELASGKINYYVGELKETDKAEIILFDKNYQEIGRQVVPFSVNQVFYISGSLIGGGNENRLLISTENQHMTITNNAGARPGTGAAMNSNFGHSPYFTLKVTGPNGDTIYNNTWYGDTYIPTSGVAASFNVPNGSTVSVYHAEGAGRRFSTNDNAALKNKTGNTYTYKMENNRLVLVNVAQS
ncbi:immunoglobulin-like domain-containing protein [Enterococcus hirae]